MPAKQNAPVDNSRNTGTPIIDEYTHENSAQHREARLENNLDYIKLFTKHYQRLSQTNPLLNANPKLLQKFFDDFYAQAYTLNKKNLNKQEKEQLENLVDRVTSLAEAALNLNVKIEDITELVNDAENFCNALSKRSPWKTLGAIALAIAAATFLALSIVSAVMVLGLGLGGTAPLAAALLWMGIQATQLALTISLAATAGASLVASPVLFFAAYKTMSQKPQTAELEAITRDGLGLFKMPPTPAQQLKNPEAASALNEL